MENMAMAAIPPAVRQAMAAEDRKLERELALRPAEVQSAAADAMMAYRAREHAFEHATGRTYAEDRQAQAMAAAAAEGRDQGATWGSPQRPALFVGDVELGPRPEAPVQRSADAPVPRQPEADRAFMARMVAARDERAEIRRRQERHAELAALEAEVRSSWGEISR
jgi:hypothetical protein